MNAELLEQASRAVLKNWGYWERAIDRVLEENHPHARSAAEMAEAVLRVAIETCAEICAQRARAALEVDREEEAENCRDEIRALLHNR